VLPQGAIPTNFIVLTAAGTSYTATINLGSAANSTAFAENLVVGVRAAVLMTGASVVATGFQLIQQFLQMLDLQQVQETLQVYSYIHLLTKLHNLVK
jgi:hypothetical protein